MRVLVVAGDRAAADMLQSHLVDLGHDPVVVASAEAALAALASDRLDAVVLDLDLPGLSGREFLQLAPICARSIPVVVISGGAADVEGREWLRRGALDVVGKPIAADRLGEALAFLELHVLNAQLAAQVRDLDRRRFARVPSVFAVHLMGYTGAEWLGTSVDLSPFGMRVRSDATLAEGATVKLHFTPPDGPPSLTVLSVLVRLDPDGQAFNFVNLTRAEFQRMSAIVQALSRRPAIADRKAPVR
jgi:CheY-like chemotaxis protein